MDMDILHAMYFQVRGIYATSSWERKNTGCPVHIRCALSMGKYGKLCKECTLDILKFHYDCNCSFWEQNRKLYFSTDLHINDKLDGGHTQPPLHWVQGNLSQGLKLASCLHLVPDIKNAWGCACTPLYAFMMCKGEILPLPFTTFLQNL
jgi:hypothetical protein